MDASSGTTVACSSYGHDNVPATHEIQGIPRHIAEWIPYCAKCVELIKLNGYNVDVRERSAA